MKTFICYLFFFFFPPFFLLCSVCYCPWCSFTCFKDLSSWERSSTPTNPLCSAEEVAHFWRGKQRSYQQVHLILYYFAETHCIPSCFGRWGGGGGGGVSVVYMRKSKGHISTHTLSSWPLSSTLWSHKISVRASWKPNSTLPTGNEKEEPLSSH